MNLIAQLTELVILETQTLSSFDQLMYGLALISPFVGLFSAWFLALSTRGLSKALLALIIPIVWTSGIGLMLFQLPAPGIRLLILSYGLSIVATAAHFGIYLIFLVANILDWFKTNIHKLWLKWRRRSTSANNPQPQYPYVVS